MAPILAMLQVDYVVVNEDRANKAHTMITSKMTREFLLPAYKRWIAELKGAGCIVISIDSDGYIAELVPSGSMPSSIAALPVKVAAGNNIVDIPGVMDRTRL